MPNERRHYPIVARIGAVLLLLVLWGVAGSDRVLTPVGVAEARSAAESRADAEALDKDKNPYDLSALRVFSRAVVLIKDNYYDPKRIEPRKMLVAALDNVERQVAEIMVDGDEKSPKIKVTVNKVSKEFDITGVETFWNVSVALKEVFDFINKNLVQTSKEETREIEYAAVNGMLSTLDPHSVLLKPEFNKEMKLHTKGEFGGVGFVIHNREGNLTVMRVLKGTPAARAGIKSKDQIVRIGNESTVSMDLNEAVSKLRGRPGSDVTITLLRNGWPTPKPMVLTRAIINVESVASKLLDRNIGYIKLKGFQGQADQPHNTAKDMVAEIKRLKNEANKTDPAKSGLKGLVIDLRSNPGGLLEQATQVSDVFLSKGTIVTTVGYSDKVREEKKAHSEDSDNNLPVVVLVNSNSASASEIVAGALKNLNRAVVVGRQTFGKGSVQMLYDFADESALKLTIAQYLTPGDISIQETGITPDIELLPSRVNKDRIDVFSPKKLVGEADLAGHFGNPSSAKAASKREEVVLREKPVEELRFLMEEPAEKQEVAEKTRQDEKQPDKQLDKAEKVEKAKPAKPDEPEEELDGEDPDTDEIVEDYQIKFARDLLVAAPVPTRDGMLKAAKPFLAQRRQEEASKIDKAIEGLGIDWSPGDSKAVAGAPKLVAEMKPLPSQKTAAGETLAWTVTVKNEGSAPFNKLRAYSESENRFLDRREFLFGTVAPGQKRSWTVNIKVPEATVGRRDEVKLKFFDQKGTKLDDLVSEVSLAEMPRPAFAYSWQIVDKCEKCNGDGVPQPGETVELDVKISNIGAGKAVGAIGVLKNKTDEHISLSKGRAKIGEILPGQSKQAVFEFQVRQDFKGDVASLQLGIGDETTDEWVADKLSIPVAAKGELFKPHLAGLRTANEISIRAAASEQSQVIAKAKKNTTIQTDGRFGETYRVRFGARIGYVAAKEVKEVRADGKLQPAIESIDMRSQPKIQLTVDASAGLSTDADRFSLSGVATDKRLLRDVYIFVNDQKVFYEAAQDGSPQIKFSAGFPLKVGNNNVVIVAREDQDFMARKTFVIHRRAPKTLAQKGAPGEASSR